MRAVASRVAVSLVVGFGGGLVGGCSAVGGGGGDAAASCAFVADFGGRRYLGLYEAEFALGEPVGTAVLPACDDTPGDGDPGVREREVRAYAVAGVDPSVAIAVDEVPGALLVVEGVGDQLPVEVRRLVTPRE